MTTSRRHTQAAFETVIETHLLAHGYISVDRVGFDRERALFPETVLAFIQETQSRPSRIGQDKTRRGASCFCGGGGSTYDL